MSYVMDPESFNSLNEDMNKAKQILTQHNIDLKDPDFLKLQELLKKRPGYMGLFTKLKFEENISVEDLTQLFNDLIDLKDLLNQLPKPVIEFQNYEEVTDAIRDLQSFRKAKAFFNALLPQQKDLYRNASDIIKKKINNLAVELNKLPKDSQTVFLKKLSRYKTLEQLISTLESFVQHDWDYDVIKDKIVKTPGAVLVYESIEDQILVARIETYEASKKLLSDTAWCISNNIINWDEYVGDTYNTQYSIWDFSLAFSDNLTRVGVTIDLNGNVFKKDRQEAAHAKDDTRINSFSDYLNKFKKGQIPANIFKPLDETEVNNQSKIINLKKDYVEALKKYKFKEIFNLFRNGLNPFCDDRSVMRGVIANQNKEAFLTLINEFGYSVTDTVSNYRHELEYIDLAITYLDSGNEEIKDFIMFLYQEGVHIHTKFKLPLTFAILSKDLELYKLLLTKGYRPDDGIYNIKHVENEKMLNPVNQLYYASQKSSISIFKYICKEYPEMVKNISDDLKDQISEVILLSDNKSYSPDDQIDIMNFFIENVKFDLNTVKHFFTDAIYLKDEKLIEKFLAIPDSLNANISSGSHRTTPMSTAASYVPLKMIDESVFSFYTDLVKKLFGMGALPCKSPYQIKELEFFYSLGDEKIFDEYLSRDGADINIDGGKFLLNAVNAKDIEKVKFILNRKANPNLPKPGNSPIVIITPESDRYFGDDKEDHFRKVNEIILLLLKAGVDPGYGVYNTVLEYAAKENVESIMKFFNEVDFNVNENLSMAVIKDWVRYTIEKRKFTDLKRLIEYHKIALSKLGASPLYQAISSQYENEEKVHDNSKLISYLIANGSVVDSSFMSLVTQTNDITLIKFLIDKGYCSVENLSFSSITSKGFVEIFEYALKKDFKLVKDKLKNNSYFKNAANNDHLGILKLANKYNLISDNGLVSCLLKASEKGHLGIIKYLESKHVDFNKYIVDGDDSGTSLTRAIVGKKLEAVKYLISKGAFYKDRKVVVNQKEELLSPFTIAIDNADDDLSIVKYFVEELKYKYSFEQMLHSTYSPELMKYLIDKGPELTAEQKSKLAEESNGERRK